MYGTVIGTSIAVDCFQELHNGGIYFLSDSTLREPLPDHVDRIYTSTHNAWLLRSRYKIEHDRIVRLPINEKLLIEDSVKKLNFYVTLINSMQKPGAVMFLFEGEDVGNILYAGKCLYNAGFLCRPFHNSIKYKLVDYLYVHEPCSRCHKHALSTSDAVKEIVKITKQNATAKVIVHEPCLREDILTDLRNTFQRPVCVSQNIMKHLEEVGRGSDFILDPSSTQIFVTDLLNYGRNRKIRNKNAVLHVVLLPCPMKKISDKARMKLKKLKDNGYHIIMYRNHCSSSELLSLVKEVKPQHTVLLRPSRPRWHRKRDMAFWHHLGNIQELMDSLDGLEESIEQPMKVSEKEFDDFMSSVDCVVVTDDDQSMDSTMVTNGDRDSSKCHVFETKSSEPDPPESFILIESDCESAASQQTVLNTSIGI